MGERVVTVNGQEGFSEGWTNDIKLDCCDGCIILWICQKPHIDLYILNEYFLCYVNSISIKATKKQQHLHSTARTQWFWLGTCLKGAMTWRIRVLLPMLAARPLWSLHRPQCQDPGLAFEMWEIKNLEDFDSSLQQLDWLILLVARVMILNGFINKGWENACYSTLQTPEEKYESHRAEISTLGLLPRPVCMVSEDTGSVLGYMKLLPRGSVSIDEWPCVKWGTGSRPQLAASKPETIITYFTTIHLLTFSIL